jgi:hypothetical protein
MQNVLIIYALKHSFNNEGLRRAINYFPGCERLLFKEKRHTERYANVSFHQLIYSLYSTRYIPRQIKYMSGFLFCSTCAHLSPNSPQLGCSDHPRSCQYQAGRCCCHPSTGGCCQSQPHTRGHTPRRRLRLVCVRTHMRVQNVRMCEH